MAYNYNNTFLIYFSLSILLILYRRQMKSICRQLHVHRTEESNTDIWLDVVKGPFHELQRELNLNMRKQCEERKKHREQELYELAWEECYIGEDKTLNVHISNIRKKIKQYSEREYIETVWGIGFRLKK